MMPHANYLGGGFMPSQNLLPLTLNGYCPPTIERAISVLTPSLFRAATEMHAIHGSTQEAILVNLIGAVSFAASGNFRIRGHNGKSMPPILHLRFVGPPLSGKTDACERCNRPVAEGMHGWKEIWKFSDVRPPTLIRKIRSGAIFSTLSMSEGRAHLRGPLSVEFAILNDLYDGQVPAFSRADDDEDVVANAPGSAIFVTCVNVQNDRHREWLKEHAEEAIGSGYQFRELILETEQVAVEGVGSLQPEVALQAYDGRIRELIVSARAKLETMSASELPVLEVSPAAEEVLRRAVEGFQNMASFVMPRSNGVKVFAIRLASNARRIAGCMHVFEGYEGGVSADTMTRAVTIAECFGASWLASVFPPKPPSQGVLDARKLLPMFYSALRGRALTSIPEAEVVTLAKNRGWGPQRTRMALMTLYAEGRLRLVLRSINGGRRTVEMVELPPDIYQPMPITEAVQRGQCLLASLGGRARQEGKKHSSWRKSEIVAEAPNFGWTKPQIEEAIAWLCEQGFARIEQRIEHGRRVINLELIQFFPPQVPVRAHSLSPYDI